MSRTLLRWLPGLLMLGTLARAEVAADVEKLFDGGDYRAAEAAARRLLGSLEPGGDTLETARALDLLASIQVSLGSSNSDTEAEINRAIAIKSRLLGPDDPAIAVSLGILGELKRLRTEYPAAIAVLEKARVMQQKAGAPKAEVADVLHRLGWALSDSGRYAEAIQLHQQVLEIRQREFGAESAPVAEVLNSLAADLWVSGQMTRAKEYVERSLRICEKTLGPDHPATANALGTLGAILKLTQDFAGARPVYERAVAILEKRLGPDHPRLATQLNNLGLCLKELNEFERAGEMLERSLHMFERILGPDNSRTASVLANLGIVYQDLGDFTRARQAYERALTIQEKRLGPDHPLVASALNSLGLLFQGLGDYAEAKRYLSRALDIYERKSGLGYPKTIDVMATLGNALAASGDVVGARPLLERAVELRKKSGPATANAATALIDLGYALFRSGDYTQARSRYEEALRIERELGPDLRRTGRCLFHLGELVAVQGDFAQAAEYHREAIQDYTKALGAESQVLAEPMAQLASELSHLGRRQEALKAALDSERIWRQHLRLTLRAIPERQALLLVDGNSGLDEALRLAAAGPALPAGDLRAIWDALIRGRALALDEMAERHRTAYSAGDPEAAALERQLGVSRTRLARLVTQGASSARLDPARRQVEADEEALAGKIIEFRRELNTRRTGYAETAAALPSGTALVAFVRYGRKPAYLAFVLKAGEEAPAVVPLGTAARIDALVNAWRSEIHREAESMGRNAQFNEQKYRTAGAALRRAVWDPVAAHLHGAGAVFVVPDGALQLVNLNTLPIGTRQYLAESGMLLHTLSAERDIADERTAPGRGLLAVGNPAYQSAPSGRVPVTISQATYRGTHSSCTDFASMQFAPLPASAQEVRTILSIWNARHEPGSALLGGEATEAAFKQSAPGKRVIHLATHGFFLEEGCRGNAALRENPLLRAGLVLAGANRRQSAGPDEEDGILTAEEVASMNLEGAEWVVLSGCDTGDGEVRAGEGVLGLRRAFRIAGVGTLIASLWPVEDEAARGWMSALYQARFRQGRSTSESMTSAMLSQLRERRVKGLSTHPFHWGSFIAVGDWR